MDVTNQNKVEGTGENVLAKHVSFFDRNHDGVIYPWETFQGFRAIGSGLLLSTLAAFFINMGLSSKTRTGKFSSLLFPIEIENITKADMGVLPASMTHKDGILAYCLYCDFYGILKFVGSKFEEIFKKHARTNPNALTSEELSEMLKANREPKDFGGWIGAYSEWKIIYYLCKDKNGFLQKDTLRGAYDGSLFEKMEMEAKRRQGHKQG